MHRSYFGRAALALFAYAVFASGCGRPRPPAFSRAETDQALSPARDLWSRCYAGSELERAGRLAIVEYRLNIEASGIVRSVPTLVQPENPRLVECVRARLDQLRFPARASDHVDVHFELGPRGVQLAPTTPVGEALGTCAPACSDGFSCRYEAGSPKGVCRVEVGRCRFAGDCPASQACQRLGQALGVCADRSP